MATCSGTHHPSSDRSGRFAVDHLIRSKGYRIAARRGEEEPVWFKDGQRFKQSEIVLTFSFDEILAAEGEEARYHKSRVKVCRTTS